MVFNIMNIKEIVNEVFGETCACYPGSGYNMIIANRYGVFKYPEAYIMSAKVEPYRNGFILTDLDPALQEDDDKVYFTSLKQFKDYLIKTNNLMSEQLRKGLPEASSIAADSILKVLD